MSEKWSSEDAQCIRLGIEEDLLYEYQGDDVYAIGATWFMDVGMPDVTKHLDAVLADERVPIPQRGKGSPA